MMSIENAYGLSDIPMRYSFHPFCAALRLQT